MDSAPDAPPNTIAFELDMRPSMEEGWFDPASEQVGLRGSLAPLTWDQTLTATDADGDGVYTMQVPFPPDAAPDLRVAFKIKVDGTGNPNGGWEMGRNRHVVLNGQPQAIARFFNEPPEAVPPTFTGTIAQHEAFSSAFLDQPRDLYIYLPPGYADEPERRYPVLYLHDGQNIFDAASAGTEWMVDENAERLITEGAIEPLIIVGVSNTGRRSDEYTPTARSWRFELSRVGTGPAVTDSLSAFVGTFHVDGEPEDVRLILSDLAGALYAQLPTEEALTPTAPGPDGTLHVPGPGITFHYTKDAEGRVDHLSATRPPEGGLGPQYGRLLVEELKPFIDQTYRTLPEAAHTGLGGSSLGGLISLYLGLHYQQVFGKLLVVSPSIWWDDEVILKDVAALETKTGQRIWLDVGTGEGQGTVDGARHLRDALQSKGWVAGADLHYVEEEGASHNEAAWAGRIAAMLAYLYPAAPGQ